MVLAYRILTHRPNSILAFLVYFTFDYICFPEKGMITVISVGNCGKTHNLCPKIQTESTIWCNNSVCIRRGRTILLHVDDFWASGVLVATNFHLALFDHIDYWMPNLADCLTENLATMVRSCCIHGSFCVHVCIFTFCFNFWPLVFSRCVPR